MTDPLNATSVSCLPLEIERLRRSKTWRLCRSEPFLAYYCINLWASAFHGIPAGSLEDDEESLAELAGCLPLDWSRIRPLALHNWEKREDGRLYHKIVEGKAREALAVKASSKRIVKATHETPRAIAEAFESWWAEYPRKIAKGAARTAYERALKKAGAEVLLEGAKRFAASVSLMDAHYVPYPATWINQERWKDGKRSDRAVVILERPITDSWNGKGAALAGIIGEAKFKAWFGGSVLSPDLSKITFLQEFQRNWAANNFMPAIRRVIGECSLDVSQERSIVNE